MAGGALKAHGGLSADQTTWTVNTEMQGVETARIDTRLPRLVVHGTANAQQTRKGVDFDLQLHGGLTTSLALKGNWNGPQWQFEHVLLQAQEASLQGPLRFNTQTWETQGQLRASMPGATVALEGSMGSQKGQGSLRVTTQDTNAWIHWLERLPMQAGSFLAGWPELQGGASLDAHWQGGWQKQGTQMQVDATLQSDHMTVESTSGQGLTAPLQVRALNARLAGTLHALDLKLHAQAESGSSALRIQSQAHGGLVQQGQFDAVLDSLQLVFKDAAGSAEWAAQLAQSVDLHWHSGASGISADLAPGVLRLTGPSPGTASIDWQAAHWSRSMAAGSAGVWQTQGRLQGLPLAWLELLGQSSLANLGLRGDIVFGGSWDASGSSHLRVKASLERSSGDLQLLSQDQTGALLRAGLRDARVELLVDDATVSAKLGWSSDGAGNASADFHSRLEKTPAGWAWPADAPVQGSIRTNLPRVGVWSLLAPPGWRMQGTLESNLALSGSRREPFWSGTIAARDMSIRSVVDGIDFSQGVLRLKLDGQQMQVEDFSLKGAGGDTGGVLKASGLILWLPANPGGGLASRIRMNLELVAQSLRVSARADQRLVVSGHLSARLDDARLSLRGSLVADQATFVLPDDTAPQLGSDVRVRPGNKAKHPVTPIPGASSRGDRVSAASNPNSSAKPNGLDLDIDVTLDPGTHFQLKGQGLDTRLEGKLNLRAQGKDGVPRLSGELRTVQGSYKAYGQTLDIEQGVLRFSGAYDNPALDILALRPQLQQRVGVQISGTVKLPVVRLYADPDMADLDKLSWLVLGRAPSTNGTDYGLLQSAALALLSGKGDSPTGSLIKNLGLDEVSLGEASTTNADGSTGAAATTVKLGKRISRDFYVAYERSIATTLGTFYVFYDLSRRFTMRAESGTTNAVDLIFTTRFD
jgi:translocation and assembly module TamB